MYIHICIHIQNVYIYIYIYMYVFVYMCMYDIYIYIYMLIHMIMYVYNTICTFRNQMLRWARSAAHWSGQARDPRSGDRRISKTARQSRNCLLTNCRIFKFSCSCAVCVDFVRRFAYFLCLVSLDTFLDVWICVLQ